jgi:hypothetical protein
MITSLYIKFVNNIQLISFLLFISLSLFSSETFCSDEPLPAPSSSDHDNSSLAWHGMGSGNRLHVDGSVNTQTAIGSSVTQSLPPSRPVHCEGDMWRLMIASFKDIHNHCMESAQTPSQENTCIYDWRQDLRALMDSCRVGTSVQSSPKT